MDKPREWVIQIKPTTGEINNGAPVMDFETIKVIEKSAADKLADAIEKYKDAIDIDGSNRYINQFLDMLECLIEYRESND